MKPIHHLLLVLLLLAMGKSADACSMYKITHGGKTMVSSNYDAYYITTKLWFASAKTPGEYGAAFSGARQIGNAGFLPQMGLNEAGLTFARLAAYAPNGKSDPNKKQITNPVFYLEDILHKCATVDEVKAYIAGYDQSYFSNEVCIYIDRTGHYIIVEPFTFTEGNDPNYVLANFCPSTTDLSTVKQQRYLNGVEYLQHHVDSSLAFCTAMTDTMHVCCERMGDGTLLSTIRDLNSCELFLFFYHDYKHMVHFNLKEELAKGDRIMEVSDLFPVNEEYEALRHYFTPQNFAWMQKLMAVFVALFLFSSGYFFISFWRKRKSANHGGWKWIVMLTGALLALYVLVLVRIEHIYFFPAPYVDPFSILVTISSYIPFLILILIIPFSRMTLKLLKEKNWSVVSRYLFALNNLVYLVLIGLFFYWGLYSVFG